MASWYTSGSDVWSYRYKFTADHTKVGADISDFPTPVKITTGEWAALANARSDGSDIFFTLADGTTRIPHVQVAWDGTTYLGFIQCDHDVDADQDFYIYCGGNPLTLVHLVRSGMGPSATTTQRVGPQAYYYAGTHKRTYFVWQDGDYTPWIAFYDHDDNRWSQCVHVATTPTGDAHYHPAVFVNASGYIFVFYGSHSSTQYYKKSTAAEDISAWGSAVAFATYATYPNILTLNGTTVYVFFRSGDADEKRGYVSYIKTTDGGTNWGSQVNVLDWTGEDTETIPYMDTGAVIGSDGSLHFTVKETINTDPTSDEDCWYFFSEDAGVTWKNRAETASKNVTTSGAITMAERSDYLAYNSTYSLYGSHIALDENDSPLILVLERASGVDAGNWVYKALRYSSGWQAPVTIVDSGSETIYGAALRHLGSGVFDAHLTVLSGSVMEIHKYQTSDRGATWTKLEELSSGSSYHASGLKLSYNAPSGEQFLLYHRDNSPEDVYAQRSIAGAGHTAIADTSAFPAAYKMWQSMADGFSTSEVLDLAANQHHGTKKGAGEPAVGTGKVGQGQVFDSSDDYIGCGDSDDFSFGNATADSAFTVQAWVNLDDISVLRPLVAKNNADASLHEWYLMVSSGKPYLVLFDEVSAVRIGRYDDTALSTSTWYHIVATYSGNGASTGINLYVDGAVCDDQDYNNGSYAAMHNTAQPLEIGRYLSATDRYMDGTIDEVMIYAGEWASTTVTTAFNSQAKPLVGESGGFWKSGAASQQESGAMAATATATIAAKSTQVVPAAAAITAAASAADVAARMRAAAAAIAGAAEVSASAMFLINVASAIEAVCAVSPNGDAVMRGLVGVEAGSALVLNGDALLAGVIAADAAASVTPNGDAVMGGAAAIGATSSVAPNGDGLFSGIIAGGITAGVTPNGDAVCGGAADLDAAASVSPIPLRIRPGASAIEIVAQIEALSFELNEILAAVAVEIGASLDPNADAIMAGVADLNAAAAATLDGDAVRSGVVSANVVGVLEILASEINLVRAWCELGIAASATLNPDLVASGAAGINAVAGVTADEERERSAAVSVGIVALLEVLAYELNEILAVAAIQAGASVSANGDAVLSGAVSADVVASLAALAIRVQSVVAQLSASASLGVNADAIMAAIADIDVAASVAAGELRVRPGASAITVTAALSLLASEVNEVSALCALGIIASATLNPDLVASGLFSAGVVVDAEMVAGAILSGKLSATAIASLSALATQVVPGALAVYMTIAVANTCLANVVANGAVTITASNALAVAATAYIAQVCGYTGTLLPGDVLEIDCDKMTVKLNGADSRRYWTGRFPKLYVGTNEVRYADDEAARTVALDEEHDPRWL